MALPAIGGFVGLIVGALFVFAVIYLANLARAPYRQRDELRLALKAIPGMTPGSPHIAEVRLHLDFGNCHVGHAGDELFTNNRLLSGVLLIQASAIAFVDGSTTVERVRMVVAGEELVGLTWRPEFMLSGVMFTVHDYFEVPKSFQPGEYSDQLLAFADASWWASKPFILTLPSDGHK